MSAPTEAIGLVPNDDWGPRQRFDIRPHGTETRSRRHRRYGEKPCAAWPPTTPPTPGGPGALMYCQSHLRRLAMPEDQAPRRNPQLGTDCPPWCRADHADTRFSGGKIRFDDAEFSGGTVSFHDAVFSGGLVHFLGALFSGGEVFFDSARDWSVPPAFPWTGTPPPGVKLPRREDQSQT